MRWLTFALPLGVALAVLPDLHDLGEGGLAIPLVGGISVIALVLAGLGSRAARRPVTARPGTFLLCCLLGGCAFWRVTTEVIWAGAHTVLDASAIRTDLLKTWITLVMGILFGIATITLGRPSTSTNARSARLR
jgi:hypothetical protein